MKKIIDLLKQIVSLLKSIQEGETVQEPQPVIELTNEKITGEFHGRR